MKRFISALLALGLLWGGAPASAREPAQDAVLAPKQSWISGWEGDGLWFTLTNRGDSALTPTGVWRLEKESAGGWAVLPRNENVILEPESGLSGYACNPVDPGQESRFRVHASLYTPMGDDAYGSYRVALEVRDASGRVSDCLSLPYRYLAAPPTRAAPGRVALQIERPFFDANVQRIRYSIRNDGESALSGGLDYRFERLGADGRWEPVPTRENGERLIPSVGVLFPGGRASHEELTAVEDYETPLTPGRYRVSKELGGGPAGDGWYADEFTVTAPESAPPLPRPIRVKVEARRADGAVGAVTLEGKDYPDGQALEDFWRELLAMQACPAPAGIVRTADLTMTLTPEKGEPRQVWLYAVDGAACMRSESGWYSLEDPGMIDRLCQKVEALGGFLPATGAALTAGLTQEEPLKGLTFQARKFNFPFLCSGWRAALREGSTIAVLQFSSASLLNRQMELVYDNGYSLSPVTYSGDGRPSYGQTVRFAPTALSPHYFVCGPLLVLYNGDDPAVLSSIASLLGPEVDTLR